MLLGLSLTAYSQSYYLNDSIICLHKKQYSLILGRGTEYRIRFENSWIAIDTLKKAYSLCEKENDLKSLALSTCMSKQDDFDNFLLANKEYIKELEFTIKKKDNLLKGGSALIILLAIGIIIK